MYGKRLTQIDFRVAKLVRFGPTQTLIGLDLYNALNSAAVLQHNTTFGDGWLTPREILTARLVKISAQLDF